jgi:dTDP-4-dehydrorhamnose reductase
LAGNDVRGVIHLSGNDKLNRYDMMARIARRLGLAEELIIRHDPASIPGRAPRPRDASLSNVKARELLDTPMTGLDDGLELVLEAAG